jgi:hypothetical protein
MTFCDFVDKHRFCCAISEVLGTLPEQDSGKHFQACLFYIRDIFENPSLNRVLAPFARTLISSSPPAPWRDAVRNEDKSDDLLAAEILHKIALTQVSAWETGRYIPSAKYTEKPTPQSGRPSEVAKASLNSFSEGREQQRICAISANGRCLEISFISTAS